MPVAKEEWKRNARACPTFVLVQLHMGSLHVSFFRLMYLVNLWKEGGKKRRMGSSSAPLLESGGGSGGGREEENKGRRWWRKLLDVEEAKNQTFFAVPMIITNICYYSITLVSVMFAGHLGPLELAGSTLANSWATVTGLALMVFKAVQDYLGRLLDRVLPLCATLLEVGNTLSCYGVVHTKPTTAASTRVSNELGAGNVDRAKNAVAFEGILVIFII
ncbi:hypothetical protein ACLOJK_000497 [Asimina triloba]